MRRREGRVAAGEGVAGPGGRAGDSWAPCAAPPTRWLVATARPRRSGPASALGVEGGCGRAARPGVCVCAGVSARSSFPAFLRSRDNVVPPRAASVACDRRLALPAPSLSLLGFGSFWTWPLGEGGKSPQSVVSGAGGREAVQNMEVRLGLPLPKIDRRLW